MTTRFDVIPESLWRHIKRGSVYTVEDFVTLQASGLPIDGVEAVLYRDDEGGRWVRPVEEFCDGRFEEVPRKVWMGRQEDDAPPEEHRIPIEDRPKIGETWSNIIGEPVLIWTVDSCGRSFGYIRVERGQEGFLYPKWGSIGGYEVLDGRVKRLCPRNPDGSINNCACANGRPAAECQLCGGYCPDHREDWK